MLQHQVESLDGVADDLKSHYVKGDDGKFTLAVEGAPKPDAGLAEKYDGAVKRNLALRQEREDMRRERDALKAASEKGGKALSDLEALQKRVDDLERAKQAAEERASAVEFGDAVRTAALKAGVHEGASVDVLGRARAAGLKMEGGEIEGLDSFFSGLRKSAAFLFNGSSGDALKGERAKTAGGPTDEQIQDEAWRAAHRDDIISGKVRPSA